ncbi:MAG: acyl carrier protein [Candidatus Margulisiibacteriota bacterium]
MKDNGQLALEIKTLVAKIIRKPEAEVTLGADLFNELGVDSLLGVEIFAALDKKYGVVIPEDLLKGVTTLGDLVQLVAEQRSSK